jgi:DNA-directed RNA polymerase specialized sigma24 family protein
MDRVTLQQRLAVDPADDDVADRDRVMRGLETLTPQDREIVALRFGADLTAPQIARVTAQPLSTVEGRLYRALRRLRDTMDAEPSAADVTGRSRAATVGRTRERRVSSG